MEQIITNTFIGLMLVEKYWLLFMAICSIALFVSCAATVIIHAYTEENEQSLKTQTKLQHIFWIILGILLLTFITGILIFVGCSLYFLIN